LEDKEAAFDLMEQEVQATLLETSGDRQLEPFRDEYEKLAKAMRKSQENERRLFKKCRELNSEIQQNSAKVQTTLKLSQEDKLSIEGLKQNIDRSWRLVDACQEKERTNKEYIQKLKTEIQALTTKLDQGASMSKKQEMEIVTLSQQRGALLKERDMAKGRVEQMQNMSQEAYKKFQKMEKELDKKTQVILTMKEKLEQKKVEKETEQRRKDALDEELKTLRLEIHELTEENKQKNKKLEQELEALRSVEQQIKDTEFKEHQNEIEYKQLMEEKKQLELKMDLEHSRRKGLDEENEAKGREVAAKKKECLKLKRERTKMGKLMDALRARTTNVEKEHHTYEEQRNELKHNIKIEMDATIQAKKEMNVDKKKIEDLLRERDILNKNVIKADARTRKEIDMMKQAETVRQNLEKDVRKWTIDAEEWKKAILNLEKRREKYGVELSLANSKHFAALEDLKKREFILADLTKETADVQSKLNQQKNLYDAVCTDRNLYSKNLIEANAEISEMKRKFKIMYHQIEQLKEEIKQKDSLLIKEHFSHHKVMKYNDVTQDKLEKAKKKVKSMMSITQTQQEEVTKIENRIQQAQTEKQHQSKEHDGIVAESDILTTQLTRRNEELQVLYEKIRIQRSNISKGDFQYKKLQKDIKMVENDLTRVQREYKQNHSENVVNTAPLKKELISLEKQLLGEEGRKQALMQELANPLNVHRWRKVEGSDPQTFELLTKVKQLQKRLIQKSEEAVEKDMLIQEKEKLYVQLKNILSRQPGPEVSQQLAWYTENLKEKTKQMKKMQGDLNEYHTKVQNLVNDVDCYNKELKTMKENYFQYSRAQMSQNQNENQNMENYQVQQEQNMEQEIPAQ